MYNTILRAIHEYIYHIVTLLIILYQFDTRLNYYNLKITN